ncbi:MAG: L,D-transpeptidase family protein, partial [Deltaproteobacteria bacterium]|nr:L,D-transpeptidase family protein [Deltaproteobacteria bacterium]
MLSFSCRSHVPTARVQYPPPPPPREERAPIVEAPPAGPVEEIPPLEPRLPARLKKPSLLPPPPIASAEDWLIVVKKGKRKLHLYRDCQLFKTFPVDLGENPQGPKLYQGDNRTPEGLYRIVEKKDRGKTKYHLALLLDYPNLRDRSRYDSALKTGSPIIGIYDSGGARIQEGI